MRPPSDPDEDRTSPEGAPAEGPAKEERPPRTSRTLKLMPGGEEGDGHPLSPSESRKARAAREHITIVFDPTPSGVPAWRVEGASGQHYRVLVPGFPDRDGAQCSCPDFLTRGLGTCKHLEATLAQAAAAPPESLRTAPPNKGPGWAEIDRDMERLLAGLSSERPTEPSRLLLEMRRVGRRLIVGG